MLRCADRVKMLITGTGTGDFSMTTGSGGNQALPGFMDWLTNPWGLASGDFVFYVIEHQNGTEWEVGYAPMSGSNLQRTSSDAIIFASSNNGAVVNFSAGGKYAYITYPAAMGLAPQQRLGNDTSTLSPTVYVFEDCVLHACGVYDLALGGGGVTLEIRPGGVLEVS